MPPVARVDEYGSGRDPGKRSRPGMALGGDPGVGPGAPKPSIAPRVTGRSMDGRTNVVGDRRRLPVTCRSLCC